MPTKTRRYPRFLATARDGTRVTLQVMPGVRVATPDDPYGCAPAPRRIVDEGGQAVERIAKGEYRTLEGVRLSSDDPDAV